MHVSIENKFCLVGGIRIHYLTAGNANSPVVLLHGGGLDCASLSWRFILHPLSQKHRVFAPDLPGYGKSDTSTMDYTTQYYITFLERFLQVLDLRKVNLLGISMGGGIALGFALNMPEMIEKLILVDSHGIQEKVPFHKLCFLLFRVPLYNRISWTGFRKSRKVVKWGLKKMFYDPDKVSEGLVNEVWSVTKKPGFEKAFVSWQKDEVKWRYLKTNLIGKLEDLKVPTLIVHGENDNFIPVTHAERAHERIRNSRLHIIPKCGHWPPREKPEEFNRVILKFFE